MNAVMLRGKQQGGFIHQRKLQETHCRRSGQLASPPLVCSCGALQLVPLGQRAVLACVSSRLRKRKNGCLLSDQPAPPRMQHDHQEHRNAEERHANIDNHVALLRLGHHLRRNLQILSQHSSNDCINAERECSCVNDNLPLDEPVAHGVHVDVDKLLGIGDVLACNL